MNPKFPRFAPLSPASRLLGASVLLTSGLLVAACTGGSDVELGAVNPQGNAGSSGTGGSGGAGASAGSAGAVSAGASGAGASGAKSGASGGPAGGGQGGAGSGNAGQGGAGQGGAGQAGQGGAAGALAVCKIPVDFKSGDEQACDASGSVKYSWNGTACAARLDGPFCACSGPDCALMFASFEACMDLNSACTSTVPCGKLVAAGDPVTVAGMPGGKISDHSPLLARINGVLETADPAIDLIVANPVAFNGPTPAIDGLALRTLSPWGAWPPGAISDAVSVGTEFHDGAAVGQPEFQARGALFFSSPSSAMSLQAPLNSGTEIAIQPTSSTPLFVVEGGGVILLGYTVAENTKPFTQSFWIDVLKQNLAGQLSWEKPILVGCGINAPTASAVRTSDGFLVAFSGSTTAEKCGDQDPEASQPSSHVLLAHVATGAAAADVALTQLGEAPQGVESTTYNGVVVPNKDVPVHQIHLTRRGSGAWLSWTREPHADGSPTDWEYTLLDEQGAPIGDPLVWGGTLFFPTSAATRVGDAIAYAVLADYQSHGVNSPTTISVQLTRASGAPAVFQTVSAAVTFDAAVSQPTGTIALLGSPDGRSVLLAWSEHQVQPATPTPDLIRLQRFDCQSGP